MEKQKYKDLKLGESGAKISIDAYIFLSCLKYLIGFISNSEALKADGLNNTTDIIASLDVIILVHPTFDVNEAHDVATQVEKALKEEQDVYEVHVHVEPKNYEKERAK